MDHESQARRSDRLFVDSLGLGQPAGKSLRRAVILAARRSRDQSSGLLHVPAPVTHFAAMEALDLVHASIGFFSS